MPIMLGFVTCGMARCFSHKLGPIGLYIFVNGLTLSPVAVCQININRCLLYGEQLMSVGLSVMKVQYVLQMHVVWNSFQPSTCSVV